MPESTNPSPATSDQPTSIIIRKSTRKDLSDCKHGKDTYDEVLKRLMKFHHEKTGQVIVE